MGHAGMGINSLYPINSLESLANSLAIGSDGTEMDVQLTKDSILVIFHDPELSPSTNGSGFIHDMTWDELSDLHYVNAPYSDYNIIRLADLFNAVENYSDYTFTFDIKLHSGSADYDDFKLLFAERLLQFYNQFNLWNNVYIESQDTEFLSHLNTVSENWRLYYYPQDFDFALSEVLSRGLDGISISTQFISTEQVQQAHDAGVFVTIWGVASKDENIDAVRKNPDMIQTDDLEYLIDLLN